MKIAILTFDGFNELDSLVALGVIKQAGRPGWEVRLVCPSDTVTSMNGVVMQRQASLEYLAEADAVLVGSGIKTRDVCADDALLQRLTLDPERQLIAAQCSGALLLSRLGLLPDGMASTDLTTRPWVQDSGVEVVDVPLYVSGNIATAGGCLASPYLAGWVIARLADSETARKALFYVAPVGEKEEFVARAMGHIEPALA